MIINLRWKNNPATSGNDPDYKFNNADGPLLKASLTPKAPKTTSLIDDWTPDKADWENEAEATFTYAKNKADLSQIDWNNLTHLIIKIHDKRISVAPPTGGGAIDPSKLITAIGGFNEIQKQILQHSLGQTTTPKTITTGTTPDMADLVAFKKNGGVVQYSTHEAPHSSSPVYTYNDVYIRGDVANAEGTKLKQDFKHESGPYHFWEFLGNKHFGSNQVFASWGKPYTEGATEKRGMFGGNVAWKPVGDNIVWNSGWKYKGEPTSNYHFSIHWGKQHDADTYELNIVVSKGSVAKVKKTFSLTETSTGVFEFVNDADANDKLVYSAVAHTLDADHSMEIHFV